MDTLIHDIIINWPTGPYFDTSCPNTEFRDWLETHVGLQGTDWDWDLVGFESLLLMFRELEAAIIFKLTFGGN